jgi:hypothetical protein
MAKVTANPDFLSSVRLGAEAGIEASVDVYMPAIAFKLRCRRRKRRIN